MKLKIKNYRAIASAEIHLSPIALVGSQNEGGKTSIAQALASVVLGDTVVVDGVNKSEAGVLVHAGASKAEIEIEAEGGMGRVVIPGRYNTKGERPPTATPFALGFSSILNMDAKARAKVLLEYLKAAPTVEDLKAELSEVNDQAISTIWQSITKLGWDGAHERAVETGKKLKAQWEDRTGERYGSAKVLTWTPQGWSADLASMSQDSLNQAVADAKSMLETAVGQAAVSAEERQRLETLAAGIDVIKLNLECVRNRVAQDAAQVTDLTEKLAVLRGNVSAAEERTRLSAEADKIPELEQKLAAHRIHVGKCAEAIKTAQSNLDNLPKPEAPPPALAAHALIGKCPHCGQPVAVHAGLFVIPPAAEDKAATTAARKAASERQAAIDTATGIVRAKRENHEQAIHDLGVLETDLEHARAAKGRLDALPRAAIKAELAEIEELRAALKEVTELRDEGQRVVGSAQAALRDAEAAKERLAGLPETTATEEEVNRYREGVRLAEERLHVWQSKSEADRIAARVELNQRIVAVLSPTGVRQAKLTTKFEEFNARLKSICEMARWKPIEIDKELDTSYGGWQYRLLSESAKYRVRAVFQVAMAQIDGSNLLAFDGADILDAGEPINGLARGRQGLLRLLATLKMPALVCMTERRQRLPDLMAMGLGRSYWIDDGMVGRAQEAAA